MKKEVVLFFAIFAIASGAITGQKRFDPSWLVYKPNSTSERPKTTEKNVYESKPIVQGNENAQQGDSNTVKNRLYVLSFILN